MAGVKSSLSFASLLRAISPDCDLPLFSPILHTRFDFNSLASTLDRTDAVVQQTGDAYRDTVALTVRADGNDVPPFFIRHTYSNAAYSSGRRCNANEAPVKGMDTARMIDYVNHVVEFVQEPSLLIVDRLSSHHAAAVKAHIASKLTEDGRPLLQLILLPPKTAFLISPLDMGAIGAFKSHFRKLDRSSLEKKQIALQSAWDAVSNESLLNIFRNCGMIGEEPLSSVRDRFLSGVVGLVPQQLEEQLDFFDAWESHAINVAGATLGRGVSTEAPSQLPEGHLDGDYWTKFGVIE